MIAPAHKKTFCTTCALLFLSVLQGAELTFPSRTETIWAEPTNDVRIGLGVNPSRYIRMEFQFLKGTDSDQELVSLNRTNLGSMELLDGQGKQVPPRFQSVADIGIYPDWVGGEFAPQNRNLDMHATGWTFPLSQRGHVFVRPGAEGRKTFLIEFDRYFNVTTPGHYTLKLCPRFYIREKPFRVNVDKKPPRYRRVDFPCLTIPFSLEEYHQPGLDRSRFLK